MATVPSSGSTSAMEASSEASSETPSSKLLRGVQVILEGMRELPPDQQASAMRQVLEGLIQRRLTAIADRGRPFRRVLGSVKAGSYRGLALAAAHIAFMLSAIQLAEEFGA